MTGRRWPVIVILVVGGRVVKEERQQGFELAGDVCDVPFDDSSFLAARTAAQLDDGRHAIHDRSGRPTCALPMLGPQGRLRPGTK